MVQHGSLGQPQLCSQAEQQEPNLNVGYWVTFKWLQVASGCITPHRRSGICQFRM